MAIYPSDPKPRVGSGDKTVFNVLKNSFEANYLQVRRASTRGRKIFNLKYNAITAAEFDILDTFFQANIGTIFTFVHPETSVNYEVTFQSDSLDREFISSDFRCNTSVILEGV